MMLTDSQRDLLPEEMDPLIKLSKKERVYIVRLIHLMDCIGGVKGQAERTAYYMRRRRAIDKIEDYLDKMALDYIIYLALDVYYGGIRSHDDSVVIIDRRHKR